MMMKIARELTTIKNTNEITSEHVLCWAKRVEVQRAKKAMIEDTKKIKSLML